MVTSGNALRGPKKEQRGFSILELLIVVVVALILAAFAIPGYRTITRNLRINGDMRDVHGAIAEAKMRAASGFTHARFYADLNANAFHLEVWNKSGNGGAGCWQTDGDTRNACTANTSPTQLLSPGVQFGFGSASAGSPNPQATIAQGPLCGKVASVSGVTNSTTANTTCIEFNSRGIPIDLTGKPTANDALYITDGNTVYGITLLSSGLEQDWATSAKTTSWSVR